MSGDLITIAPLVVVGLTAVAVLLSDALTPSRRYAPIAVALAGLGSTCWILLQQGDTVETALSGAYIGGPFVAYLGLLGSAVVALTLLVSPDHLAARRYPSAEFAATLLFALCGAIMVGASGDLVTLFIGRFAIIMLFRFIINLFIDNVFFGLFDKRRCRRIRPRHDLNIARHHNITTFNMERMRAGQSFIH